jgi:hypothetical protein
MSANRLLLAIALSFAGLSCGSGGLPDDISGCEDAACRQAVVVKVFDEQGAEAAAVQLRQMEQPEERIATILFLFETQPERSTQLCRELPAGPTQARCQRATNRPHLWTPARVETEATTKRTAPGPLTSYLLPDADQASVFTGSALSAARCTRHPDPRSCLTQDAVANTLQGRAERGSRSCKAIDKSPWREECFFNIAEAALERNRSAGYVDAINLCLDAGDFTANCIAHLSLVMAGSAPSSTESDPAKWVSILEAARVIEGAWASRDAEFGLLLVDRFWADVAAAAFAGSKAVTGDLFRVLPSGAWPHVRAAAALRLVALDWDEGRTLDAWLALLRAAMEVKSTAVEPKRQAVRFLDVPDRWAKDLPGDELIPAIFYMGTSRRTTVADTDEDLTLCLLEALGRREPLPTALLEAASADPRPAVAWTAKRLLNPEANSPPPVPTPSAPSEATPDP